MVVLSINKLELERDSRSVRYRGALCSLTPTSFDLLECLMRQPVVSVDELLEQVWHGKVVDRAAVKQQIKALRAQLGKAGGLVESVRGYGYRIQVRTETLEATTLTSDVLSCAIRKGDYPKGGVLHTDREMNIPVQLFSDCSIGGSLGTA